MRTSTTAICLIASGVLTLQGQFLTGGGGVAHAAGGGFGGGGFHGGSVGNAGHVSNHPYYGGGYSGYTYPMGPVGFEGDPSPSGSGSGSGAAKAYTGSATVPPRELQDGRGVYVPLGSGDADGPSWDSDWWDQDPRGADAAAAEATDLSVGTAVTSLPRGCDTVYVSSDPYYFLKGIYYQAAGSGYQVVAPPLGIEVNQLPSTAEMVKVDRLQYFVYNDTYYQALFGGSGVVYKVVEDPNS